MVLRNGGPIGAPGFLEFGTMPIPAKLLREGVEDIVRISDSRISGTSFGTLVVHVAPESAVGVPSGSCERADPIVLDAEENRLDIDVGADELAAASGLSASRAGLRARLRRALPRARPAGSRRSRLDFLRNLDGEARPCSTAAHERLGQS
jgi:dihydroxyacid dehydratase/phosphogluconate dehydratase